MLFGLIEKYIEQNGDPETNGLGHVKTRAMWKDGVERDVVLVPLLDDGTVDVDWEWASGYQHTTMLDDGEMFPPPQQAFLTEYLQSQPDPHPPLTAEPEKFPWEEILTSGRGDVSSASSPPQKMSMFFV